MLSFHPIYGRLRSKIYNSYLLYFIAILQWSIGHPSSASIDGGFWLELVVRQMMFSRIPPKQCASRWLWGVHVIFVIHTSTRYSLDSTDVALATERSAV
jgi:hypothetical protein